MLRPAWEGPETVLVSAKARARHGGLGRPREILLLSTRPDRASQGAPLTIHDDCGRDSQRAPRPRAAARPAPLATASPSRTALGTFPITS